MRGRISGLRPTAASFPQSAAVYRAPSTHQETCSEDVRDLLSCCQTDSVDQALCQIKKLQSIQASSRVHEAKDRALLEVPVFSVQAAYCKLTLPRIASSRLPSSDCLRSCLFELDLL